MDTQKWIFFDIDFGKILTDFGRLKSVKIFFVFFNAKPTKEFESTLIPLLAFVFKPKCPLNSWC